VPGPIVQMASNLRMRSVRQAYDDVLSEGSPHNYQEFIQHAASADQDRQKVFRRAEAQRQSAAQ
jgi:hypothetical protein